MPVVSQSPGSPTAVHIWQEQSLVNPRETTSLRVLKFAAASLWLATGVGVLHPYYREVGSGYLGRIGLPDALMYATCAFEVGLGLWVMLKPQGPWLTLLQVGMVAVFSLILGVTEPMLLVHPMGVLTKNLPFVAVVLTIWLVENEGWSDRAKWLLRAGMAVIWMTEGLFPKLLFQQPYEIAIVEGSGLIPGDASLFLMWMGAAQIASGVAVLALRGKPLRFVLGCHIAALIVLPLLVGFVDPALWFHPFGPLTKNIVILLGTIVVWRIVAPERDR